MFHKEGHKIILITLAIVVGLSLLIDNIIELFWLRTIIMIVALIFLLLILQFFRNPKRYTKMNDDQVLSPVDAYFAY